MRAYCKNLQAELSKKEELLQSEIGKQKLQKERKLRSKRQKKLWIKRK